ncbi:MAG: MinD/ParA family protein [Syntrophorhabdaceae bacterium]|nr:MinD/ParA family protein [Syntrophorhabdaceae bacterium]
MVNNKKRTITITSGKGGVGKSSIVSNMAYILGANNSSTYIFDADLSLGNIDIMFGMVPKYNIMDFLEGRKTIGEIIMEGPCGIRIIPGSSGISELSNLSMREKNMLYNSFQELPNCDFFLIDTSAGISSNVIYFNSISEKVFVVITPDPASITDSYAVIKVLSKKTGREDFGIIVNMVKDEGEAIEVFKKILSVTDRFLNVYLDFVGFIPLDRNIGIATKKQRLWVEAYPDAASTKELIKICHKVAG